MGLPAPIRRAAMVVFEVSVVGTLGCLGIFFWYDTGSWEVFEAIVFLVCFAIFLVKLLWMLPLMLFA